MAMDGTVVEQLIVEWRADYSKLTQDIDKIKAELGAARAETKQVQDEFRAGGKAAEVFGNGMNSIVGKAARAAAAIFSVHKAVGYLKNSIQLAMDVVESDSLFETTMGRWTDSTRKWADSLEHSLGVNAFEVRKNVGVWYTMTESMGLSEEQALNMSKSLVQLKYDLASFYNIADERAESVIEGMITGITAPAKQIGVVLTDEVAKRELLAEGIIKQGQAVDSTTMMYGRYLALMKQTETAHGDMARTIDSPANQLRVMQAALRNASLEMGQAFLPIVQTVLPWLQYLASFIKIVANALASLFGGKGRSSKMGADQAEITTGLGGVKLGVAEGEEGWKKYGNTADKALGKAKRGVKELQAAIMGFDQIHKVEEKSTPGGALGPTTPDFGNINADIDSVLDGLDQWIDKTTEIDEKVQGFINTLKNTPIGAFGMAIYDAFAEIYNSILKPLGSWLMDNSEWTIAGLEGILLGVLAFKGVGAIFGPTSPIAIASGIIVGLAGAIDGFLRESMRKKMLEDMATRWGDIALNAEQVDRVIRGVFETMGSQLARDALVKAEQLAEKSQDWQKALQGIMSETYSFKFGVEIEEVKREDLKKAIDDVIAKGQEIIAEAKFNLPITFANVNLGDETLGILMSGYDQMEADFVKVGERLRKAFDNAIADGIITDEEFELIRRLQLELAEIMRRATDVESQIALEQIYKNRPGVAFTEETFRAMQQKAEEWLQERYDTAQVLHIKQRIIIELNQDLSDVEKQDLFKKLEDHYNREETLFQLRNIKFQMDTLKQNFSDVFEAAKQGFAEVDMSQIKLGGPDGWDRWMDANFQIDSTRVDKLQQLFRLDKIAPAARKNLESFYNSLAPTSERLMALYESAKKAGEKIPEGVAAGLISLHSVGAAAGNANSLMFMLGKKMSESPEARELYEEAKRSGEKINEHYAAGMEAGIALPGEVTDEMINLLIGKLDEGGIDILAEIEKLGYEIPEGLAKEVSKNSEKFKLSGQISAKTWLTAFRDYLGRNPLKYEMRTKITTDTIKAGTYFTAYAEGGLPEIGEFFVAREAGPELVGRMGSRTAVANNDQIVAGIESGVFRAVVAALGGGGMQRDSGNTYVIPVYVGGEKLYEVVFDRAKRESIRAGRPLMEGV